MAAALLIAGAVAVALGVAIINLPAGLIVVGLFLLVGGALLDVADKPSEGS